MRGKREEGREIGREVVNKKDTPTSITSIEKPLINGNHLHRHSHHPCSSSATRSRFLKWDASETISAAILQCSGRMLIKKKKETTPQKRGRESEREFTWKFSIETIERKPSSVFVKWRKRQKKPTEWKRKSSQKKNSKDKEERKDV